MESSEAGTSSGSEYQVFLNFRGPDTRSGFTDCLYHSLIDAGICVFRDSEKLHVGERIDAALRRAIDYSRIYIPIFSQNYASSQWCLRELTQIVKNTSKSNGNKEILPIFFDVEPDDVKMKTPLYCDAILNLERKKTLSTKETESWKKALEEVDAIKGWEVKKYDGQGKLIKLVVEEVVNKLMIKDKSVTEHLIGIDDRVVAVKNLLDVDSGGGRLIQIHGMGGIGKTTLAKIVFNQLSTHFGKSCYFLEDVREKSSRKDGLVELQRKFLSEIGNAVGIGSIDATDHLMKRIEEILCNKKVFIVLDDVDKSEQVEKLVGKGALCSGSRVLITTRNNNVLQITGPKYEILKYEMELMSSDHAFQLFNRHAFNSDSPPYDYHGISKKIVSATGRLPLTIEVIGSLLCDETEEIWKETLGKLSKTLLDGVYGKLKISYEALTFEQQQIFLDIACLLIGKEKTNAIYMWNDQGLSPFRGIEVLKRMSLIKIVKGNEFWMHDQLRDLGREIVRQEKPNPKERSRLWTEEDILDTIKIGKVRNVEAMELCHANVHIKSEEIRRFEKLRFLGLIGGTFVGNLKDCFPKLCWIYWYRSALKCELTNMCLKNVVVVNLSSIAGMDDMKLWSLIKEASKLKVLCVDSCSGITRIPDLSGCSTLERLTFSHCYRLRKIDGSIGQLHHLIELKFDHCFDLEGLPKGIEDLRKLEHFCLESCSKIMGLPNSIFKLESLRELQFSIRSPVELPDAIRKLEKLEVLQVEGNLKGQLPSDIGLLPRLQKLVLEWCNEIRELPALPISLTHLAVSSKSMQVVPNLSNLTKLVELDLNDGSRTSELDRIHTGDLRWIGKLSNLERLRLCLLRVPAPTELALLPRLNQLYLSGLDLQPSTQVPSSLLDLTLGNFNSVALLSSDLKNLSNLKLEYSQMQAIQLDGHQLPNLTDLHLYFGGPLKRFMLSSMRKLKMFEVGGCPKLYEIHIAGKLESLERLDIGNCGSLRRFVYDDMPWESSLESTLFLASGVFNKLCRLWLQDCPNILSIQIVDTSESLKELELCRLRVRGLGGLSNLKNLRFLKIWECGELQTVEGLDETTQLPYDCHLKIISCPKLRGIEEGFRGSIQRFKRYEEEESVLTACTGRLMLAEGSRRGQMYKPGSMAELQAKLESLPQNPFFDLEEVEEEEDHDTGEQAAAPATGSAATRRRRGHCCPFSWLSRRR